MHKGCQRFRHSWKELPGFAFPRHPIARFNAKSELRTPNGVSGFLHQAGCFPAELPAENDQEFPGGALQYRCNTLGLPRQRVVLKENIRSG